MKQNQNKLKLKDILQTKWYIIFKNDKVTVNSSATSFFADNSNYTSWGKDLIIHMTVESPLYN